MSFTIRPLQPNDFQSWLPLWDANNLWQRDEKVTTTTWERLMDSDYPIHGLCALKNGEMAGLVHYVLHATTGAIEPVCYMQDVFVAENYRKQGIARALVEEVVKRGKSENWARLYWLADANNEAAQALYKNIGVKMNFTLFIQPL
ncbi:MAG: N-acetyltransferase family protein [Alphaproteobacteria bacterium]